MSRRSLRSRLLPAATLLLAMLVVPARSTSYQSGLGSVKTVFVILFENTNWASVTPSVAPYIRTTVVPMGGLEAGHHLGLTTNNDASAANSTATKHHLVRYLQNAGISVENLSRGHRRDRLSIDQ